MARYTISDIHGCPRTFCKLLDRIALIPVDELYLLGDYIDRGPDSHGVLTHIWKLRAEGYRLSCLRGNHEQMLLDAVAQHRAPWDYRPQRKHLQETLDWIGGLPYYLETPGYLLVHAGLNFYTRDPLADTEAMLWARNWEEETDREWLGDRTVIYGHTPRSMREVSVEHQRIRQTQRLCIDSGCAMPNAGMGYLTALNLDSGELTFQENVERG